MAWASSTLEQYDKGHLECLLQLQLPSLSYTCWRGAELAFPEERVPLDKASRCNNHTMTFRKHTHTHV